MVKIKQIYPVFSFRAIFFSLEMVNCDENHVS